ncbi:MAG: GrpB family protein, partial [Actinomycetota bacterium]
MSLSLILVPVPEAERAVSGLRRDLDPSASAGIPAHVTVMFPFLPADEIDAGVQKRVAGLVGSVDPFEFVLAETGRFDPSVLYLDPQPSRPFVTLTERVGREFGLKPYAGAFEAVIPHLTVGDGAPEPLLDEAEVGVKASLPIRARAREAWLMVQGGERWVVRKRFPLGERSQSAGSRRVVVAEYDPLWPEVFDRERQDILRVAGHVITRLEHVGSTSVPGLLAKPVIDILAGVEDLYDSLRAIAPLRELGYEYVPEYENELRERRYFRKGDPQARTHHVHLVEVGSHFWKRHLAFRDHLRADQAAAEEYARLKGDLARRFPEDREAYTEAKGP